MALFGKKEDKEKKQNRADAQVEAQADTKADAKPRVLKEDTGNANAILVRPLLTEKSYKATTNGKYTFKVSANANKISVRNAVEKVFDVHVTRVNILNVRGKNRAYAGRYGKTQAWKKAIVSLRAGETIQEGKI